VIELAEDATQDQQNNLGDEAVAMIAAAMCWGIVGIAAVH